LLRTFLLLDIGPFDNVFLIYFLTTLSQYVFVFLLIQWNSANPGTGFFCWESGFKIFFLCSAHKNWNWSFVPFFSIQFFLHVFRDLQGSISSNSSTHASYCHTCIYAHTSTLMDFLHKLVTGHNQGCQIFLGTTYQNGGKYINGLSKCMYTKWSQNIPTCSIPKLTKIYPNSNFWYEKILSGNPGHAYLLFWSRWNN
jgi:hypothetical protein